MVSSENVRTFKEYDLLKDASSVRVITTTSYSIRDLYYYTYSTILERQLKHIVYDGKLITKFIDNFKTHIIHAIVANHKLDVLNYDFNIVNVKYNISERYTGDDLAGKPMYLDVVEFAHTVSISHVPRPIAGEIFLNESRSVFL